MEKQINIPHTLFGRIWHLIKLNSHLWVALLAVFCVGIVLLIVSKILRENSLPFSIISHEIGVLCITITPMLFIYELALRRHFIKEMSAEIETVIDNMGIKKEVTEIIRRSMPSSYNNILTLGVSDAYPNLDSDHLRRRITEARDTEIRLIKIWIPFLDEALDPDLIIEAIETRNCTFKIILFDPDCGEAITKRVRTLSYDPEYYHTQIITNIKYLHNIWQKLKKIGKEECLKVKIHDDFISISLIGFKDYYIFGIYLHGKVATRGMHYKIDKGKAGKENEFYKQLDTHFAFQWDIAHKRVDFETHKYTINLIDKNND